MIRFVLFCCLVFTQNLVAQSITWTTSCANRNLCLNLNQCSIGTGLFTEKAVTTCQTSPILSYSYKLDLDNNGSIDMQAAEDSLNISLSKGTHRLHWRATDNCGKVSSCSYNITVKDCQPPNLLCINGLAQSVNLPDCAATFTPSQFILSLSDNCTPKAQIQVGIREEDAGMGFPTATSVTFDKCRVGQHGLEVWVKDENGLTNSCYTYVLVQQSGTDCKCITDGDLTLSGCVRTHTGQKLDDFLLRGQVESVAGAPTAISKKVSVYGSDSCFNLLAAAKLPVNQGYKVRLFGEKNNAPLNGISTYDLVLISKHILGLEPLPTIYHALAADANRSNSVTTFDIVEIRKLILGIYDTLPAAKSWRFVRPVPNPSVYSLLEVAQDTFKTTLPTLQDDVALPNLDLIAIKTGDVNNSAYPGFTSTPEDRDGPAPPLHLLADDPLLQAGTTLTLPLRLAAPATLSGWQIALAVDPTRLRIEGLPAVASLPAEAWQAGAKEGMSEYSYFLSPDGQLRALWHDATARDFPQGYTLFPLKVRALQKTTLSESLTLQAAPLRPEAYGPAGERQPMSLFFQKNEAAGQAQFFPPSPNPTSGEAAFGALLHEPAAVRLDVWDAAGRLVYSTEFPAPAGRLDWVLPASALPQSGVYGWRAAVGERVWAGKVLRW